MKKLLLLAFIAATVLFAKAQGPQQINYQGVARNSVGSIIANQNISLRLSVRDASANGPVVYSESRNLKTNSYGLFVTAIGSSGATNVTGSFNSINWSSGIKFLQVEIDPKGAGNYIDMGTAQLLSVPYALYANAAPPVGNAGGDLIGNYPSPYIRDGVITNSKIGDGEISASKLQPGVIPNSLSPSGNAGGDLSGTYPNPSIKTWAIDSSKISDNSVSTSKIQDASVTAQKLAPGVIPTSLTPSGNAGGDLSGTYPNPVINNGVISNSKLADNSVSTIKIQDASVTNSKMAPGVIPTTLPPSGNAGGDLAGTYPNPNVANNAITNQKIADGAVTNPKLADNSVSTIKIQDGAITASKLAPGLIPSGTTPTGTAGGDLSGTYPNPTIASNAVTTIKIADGSVTSTKLAAGVIPTSLPPTGSAGGDLTGTYPNPTINTNAITTTKIADNSITTSKVVDGSITSTKLAPGVIPTSLPPSGTAGGDLTGSYPNPTLSAGVVDNTKLADNSVGTTKLQDASVTSSKLAPGIIPTSLPPNGSAGGDLSGSYPNPTLDKIKGIILSATAPTTGQVLKYDGTQWIPSADNVGSGGSPTGSAGGDLTGTYPNPVLNTGVVSNTKLADNSVSTSKVQDGSITSSKLAAGVIPTSLPPSGIAGGDLSSSYPNPVVSKIRGITVANVAPTTGQVLSFDGSQWTPSTVSGGGGSLTLPYSSTTTSSSNLFSVTNSGAGSALSGTNSSTSSNVSGVVGTISSTTPGAMSAAVKGVNNGTGTNGIGVYGVHAGNGYGVYGNSNTGTGVFGNSPSGFGLYGSSSSGTGVFGESTSGNAASFNVSDVNNINDALFVNNAGQGNSINSYSEQSNSILAVTNSASSSGLQAFNNAGGTGIWGITFGTSGPALKATNTADGGTALQADLWGPTGDIAVFQLNGTNQARIDANGKGFFNGGTQNSGADVAESFDVEGNRSEYEPGDVLVISQSSDRTVEKSQTPYSTLVAGVYATKPGVLLTEKTNQTQIDMMVPMGVVGVIPTKVCLEGGVIKRGDLIVTSSTPGVAMKADPDKVKIGQVIGKALEDYSSTGIGKIKVLVSIK